MILYLNEVFAVKSEEIAGHLICEQPLFSQPYFWER